MGELEEDAPGDAKLQRIDFPSERTADSKLIPLFSFSRTLRFHS
jgi:hypothetical protein